MYFITRFGGTLGQMSYYYKKSLVFLQAFTVAIAFYILGLSGKLSVSNSQLSVVRKRTSSVANINQPSSSLASTQGPTNTNLGESLLDFELEVALDFNDFVSKCR